MAATAVDGKDKKLKQPPCVDRFPQCIEHLDDCEQSPGWMTINCPVACNFCHLRDPKVRCDPSFLNVSTESVLGSGDMNTIFERLETIFNFTILSRDPWMAEKDQALSEEVVTALLAHPSIQWERSHESGEINSLGEGEKIYSQARTSSSYWCQHSCQQSNAAQEILSTVETLLGIDSMHYEPLQLLQYQVGEKYVPHHDYSFDELGLLCGPRILTVFLYLSDVEEGGETNFPKLSMAIKPTRGKILIWPNTLVHEPLMIDGRMMHEAKPVLQGVKYAANIWVHAKEWTRPSLWACTGAETTY
jgi:prolyl 4-hydroxylase